MARSDILLYDDGVAQFPSSKRFTVKANPVTTSTNPSIKAGEFVLKLLGPKSGTQNKGSMVTAWGVSLATKPECGTDYLAGLAMSDSTESATVNGYVDIMPITAGVTYLIVPNAPTSWDTQAEYDALVGARVKLNTSSTGVQTLLATDDPFGGFVVEPLDIIKYPGKVRVSAMPALSYLNPPPLLA